MNGHLNRSRPLGKRNVYSNLLVQVYLTRPDLKPLENAPAVAAAPHLQQQLCALYALYSSDARCTISVLAVMPANNKSSATRQRATVKKPVLKLLFLGSYYLYMYITYSVPGAW